MWDAGLKGVFKQIFKVIQCRNVVTAMIIIAAVFFFSSKTDQRGRDEARGFTLAKICPK
jgi:hypothetical protein